MLINEKEKKAIHSGHRLRLKESFLAGNAEVFRDHQLLELLLFYSIPRSDTNETAHALLLEFGSLEGVFKAPYNALLKVEGVGEQTALMIRTVAAIDDRRLMRGAQKENLTMTFEDISRYLTAFYRSRSKETIVLLSCDNKRRVKKADIVGEGGVNGTDINSRNIVESAINANASFVVLSHNHPNGAAKPSAADVDATRSLIVMLRRLDIGVYDHVIVGMDSDVYSMREHDEYKMLFI